MVVDGVTAPPKTTKLSTIPDSTLWALSRPGPRFGAETRRHLHSNFRTRTQTHLHTPLTSALTLSDGNTTHTKVASVAHVVPEPLTPTTTHTLSLVLVHAVTHTPTPLEHGPTHNDANRGITTR